MTLPDFLTMWPHDEIMVKGHRIGLYHVISEYHSGKDAEQLQVWFPTLEPELIQKILEFYHSNREEVDAYLDWMREELRKQSALFPRMDKEAMRRRAEERKRTTKG